jgi:hypothetical protein
MLRAALNLQLDAMLVTLGAAARARSRGEPESGTPWSRWLVEDLDLARALATTLAEGDDVPSAHGLGGSLASTDVETAFDHLVARFENLQNLLVGVLSPSAQDSVPNPPVHDRPRGYVADALRRCRTRLTELHRCRREAVAEHPLTPHPRFLPGEWLG